MQANLDRSKNLGPWTTMGSSHTVAPAAPGLTATTKEGLERLCNADR